VAVAKDLQGAIDLAARILEEMGVREPPVPDSFIYSIDPARTVRVVVEPLRRGTRGATMLSPDGTEWWVVLNANDRYPVRRFTLAHEAFHIACGTGLAFRRDGLGEFYECSLADHFASHLLLPEAWLTTRAAPRANWIATVCRVSRRAAELRLSKRATAHSHKRISSTIVTRVQ
jgi:Zn-dependent peptidase ImmA (M78 family)